MLIEQYKEEKIIPFLQAVKNYEYSGSVVRLKAFDTLIITDGTLKSAMRIESDIEEEYDEDMSIIDSVNLYIRSGLSSMDAIKRVAKERKISKNTVYMEFHGGDK